MFLCVFIYIYIYIYLPMSHTATLYWLCLYIIWNVLTIQFTSDHTFYAVFAYEFHLKFDISCYILH